MQITCENAFINLDFVNQSMNIIHRLNPIKKKDAYSNYDVDFYTEQLFIKKEEPLYLEISHFLDVIQKKKKFNYKSIRSTRKYESSLENKKKN